MTTDTPPASAMRAAFLVDHRELTPEISGADLDRLGGDRRQRVGRAKHVDDVHGNRDIEQTGAALLAEDLGLARVDRNHAVPVTFEVVPDEIARAQLVFRQSDDGDGLRVVQDALDRQRILIAGHIERRAHRDATSLVADAAARAKPCSRSQIRSSIDSVPTESRMVPGPTPAALSSSSFS